MQETELFNSYTLQSALDKLDVIECFEEPGQKLRVGDILEKQSKSMKVFVFLLLPRYELARIQEIQSVERVSRIHSCVAVRQQVYPVFLFSKILRMEKGV